MLKGGIWIYIPKVENFDESISLKIYKTKPFLGYLKNIKKAASFF